MLVGLISFSFRVTDKHYVQNRNLTECVEKYKKYKEPSSSKCFQELGLSIMHTYLCKSRKRVGYSQSLTYSFCEVMYLEKTPIYTIFLTVWKGFFTVCRILQDTCQYLSKLNQNKRSFWYRPMVSQKISFIKISNMSLNICMLRRNKIVPQKRFLG